MKKVLLILTSGFISSSAFSGPLNSVSGGVITNNITMNVPSKYSTVQEALLALDNKTITNEALVTIQIADGVYADYESIEIDNPYASRIQILGNVTNSSYVKLQFKNNVHGIVVHSGTSLAYFAGFEMEGSGSANINGLYVYSNSSVSCGNIKVSGFWTGFRVSSNAEISCPGVEASYNSAFGYAANQGSVMNVTSSIATHNGLQGYAASKNSVITAYGATITNNGIGISVYEGGIVNAQSAVLSANGANYNVQDSVSYIRTQ